MSGTTRDNYKGLPDGVRVFLARLAILAGMAFCAYAGVDLRYGVLLVACPLLLWGVLRTYDDWATLLKRCIGAIPFIILVEIEFYFFLPVDLSMYWVIGGLLLPALLLNVRKVLPHYCITFLTVVAVIITVRIRENWNDAVALHQFSTIFIIFFYTSYLVILNRNQSYISVAIKAAVAGMMGVLFTWIFIVANRFAKQNDISPAISYGFFCLLGICCFLVFYGLGKKYFKANDLFKKGKIMGSSGE